MLGMILSTQTIPSASCVFRVCKTIASELIQAIKGRANHLLKLKPKMRYPHFKSWCYWPAVVAAERRMNKQWLRGDGGCWDVGFMHTLDWKVLLSHLLDLPLPCFSWGTVAVMTEFTAHSFSTPVRLESVIVARKAWTIRMTLQTTYTASQVGLCNDALTTQNPLLLADVVKMRGCVWSVISESNIHASSNWERSTGNMYLA